MLHGIGSNSSGYRNQLHDLSDRFRMVSWDAPGYGESAGFADEAPTVDDYADAVLGLLDALGIDRAHIVGSSLGALFAAKLAAVHPHRVRSIALSAPATGFGCRAPEEARAHVQGRIDDFDRLGAAGLARERAAKLVAADASPEVLAIARDLVGSINRAGYVRTARVLGSANIMLDAPLIKAPTLIMVGRLDRITPLAECAGPIHAAIPHSRLEVLDGVAHLLKLEAPQRVNSLLTEFFLAPA
ncbi:MAG: alpha/beta fold hydrolase [Burkholderiales bacterium]|nr:alpha/beta fold hydrolase [Burkholderiales bacterium]